MLYLTVNRYPNLTDIYGFANKPSISIQESVLPYGEVLVFQFKCKHDAPRN